MSLHFNSDSAVPEEPSKYWQFVCVIPDDGRDNSMLFDVINDLEVEGLLKINWPDDHLWVGHLEYPYPVCRDCVEQRLIEGMNIYRIDDWEGYMRRLHMFCPLYKIGSG